MLRAAPAALPGRVARAHMRRLNRHMGALARVLLLKHRQIFIVEHIAAVGKLRGPVNMALCFSSALCALQPAFKSDFMSGMVYSGELGAADRL